MGYVFCGHRGSGDHSCEDRVRGTCRLLGEPPELYSSQPEEDWHYGLGHLAGVYRQMPGAPELRSGDLLLVDGAAVPQRSKKGVRPILWGWTAREPALSRKTVRALSGCEAVVVMDSRSLEILRHGGLGKKARLGPDLSFLVERRIRPLRGAFRQDTVGLCLSPGCCPFEGVDGLLYHSYCGLIRFLLEETAFQIALIPYCVKERRNDLLLMAALERQFRGRGRIFLREDGDCRCLRGDISLCRCVVGASGAVAAWSCGVPALCLGANGRSMGLAGELFGSWQEAVVPIGSLKDERDLTDRFRFFLSYEDRQRRTLERAVPLRRQQAAAWDWTRLGLPGA